MCLNIIKYDSSKLAEWDNFIDTARNAHFMFKRGYMDYHSDRFIDASLMIYDDKGRLLAVMPLNVNNDKAYTHQGLTFGGLVLSMRATAETVLRLMTQALNYCKDQLCVSELIYKRIPDFYHSFPAQEDLYVLFRLNAELFRRDISSTILLEESFRYTKGRKWSINKAKKANIKIKETYDFSLFWDLLNKTLQGQHGTKPVHTIQEITLLRSRLPKNIRCFTANDLNGRLLAGTVIYETDTVAHTKYLANSELGRDLGALDLLLDRLITETYARKKYFDFGISTEEDGKCLNTGLIAQKEGFGARAFVYDFFKINLMNI